MSRISTHILDTSLGRPASGIAVELCRGSDVIATGVTDADGRVADLWNGDLETGTYRICFAVGEYFRQTSRETFYPDVRIDFSVVDPGQHFHIPLLLSPFGYSTYRGS
ncbi:MAG: hydroxyisourate hydrolase [Rhodoglobus sp.]